MRWRTPLAWKENLWKGDVGAASARRIPQPDQAGESVPADAGVSRY